MATEGEQRGTSAMRANAREWAEQRRGAKARQAAQKAARDARAYEDWPGTRDELLAYHRQLKAECLRRLGGQRDTG